MNSFLETLRQLGPARLAIMGGILVGLLMFFVFVSMRVSAPKMKMIYDQLSTSDSGAMSAKLETAKIPYEVSDDGARISVPQDQVGKARMLLAQEGLPNGGSMGYELFDQQSGFGTTNFVQNINQVRALEGELARTIGSIESIRSARVHLVLPQRELFARESRPATASVALALRPGATLDRERVMAIQSLVASAVPDMKASGVSVIDTNGNLLARGGEDSESLLTAKAEEMRRSYEQQTARKIEDLVSNVVGFGKVRANVTAELNFDQINTNEELYDPNGQVVRSTQSTAENNTERNPPSGDVSVDKNLPAVAGDVFVDSKPVAEGNKTEEVTNYEISKTVRSTVRQVGEVNKLSVAVLIDGTYTEDKDGKRTYQPRPQEEVDHITQLVKSTIGFDEKRGDTLSVANMQFAEVDATDEAFDPNLLFGFERSDLLDAGEIIVVAVMIILVILLVVQPMIGRLLSIENTNPQQEELEANLLAGVPMNPALEAPSAKLPMEEEEDSLIDMQKVEGKVKASSVKKVEDIVASYPSETVNVIRSWMSQEG